MVLLLLSLVESGSAPEEMSGVPRRTTEHPEQLNVNGR
jgi:hypothetical protein